MYEALAFVLAKDAVTHDGPGDLSRIDLVSERQKIVTDGASLTDVLTTETIVLELVLGALTYSTKLFTEPDISRYSQNDVLRQM